MEWTKQALDCSRFETLQTWAEKDLGCLITAHGHDYFIAHNAAGGTIFRCTDLDQVEETLRDIARATAAQ